MDAAVKICRRRSNGHWINGFGKWKSDEPLWKNIYVCVVCNRHRRQRVVLGGIAKNGGKKFVIVNRYCFSHLDILSVFSTSCVQIMSLWKFWHWKISRFSTQSWQLTCHMEVWSVLWFFFSDIYTFMGHWRPSFLSMPLFLFSRSHCGTTRERVIIFIFIFTLKLRKYMSAGVPKW